MTSYAESQYSCGFQAGDLAFDKASNRINKASSCGAVAPFRSVAESRANTAFALGLETIQSVAQKQILHHEVSALKRTRMNGFRIQVPVNKPERGLMKHLASLFLTFLLILGPGVSSPPSTVAKELEPVLEDFSIAHVGERSWIGSGVEASIYDRSFGGGGAKALVEFNTNKNSSQLSLKVWRKMKPGQIAFALLVFHVNLRTYDGHGKIVYSRDLGAFSFGDSSSGRWSRTFRRLPADIRKLQIVFVGNYE